MLSDELARCMHAQPGDNRLPIVVLLGQTAPQALHSHFVHLAPDQLASCVVFAPQDRPDDWPPLLRYQQVPDGDLVSDQGCLCCSMNAQLPSLLSRLFLRVLRREESVPKAVVLVTLAESEKAIEMTLRHAPFLRQRYRLAGCLPPAPG